MSVRAFLEEYLFVLFTTGIALCIMVAASIVARRRAAGFSVPRPATGPFIRWGEAVLWSAGLVLLMLSFRSQFRDYLKNPNTVAALLSEVERRTLYVALACVPVVLAAVLRMPRLAGMGLVVLVVVSLNPTLPPYRWPVVEAAVSDSPMPFTISTPPDLPPVSVSINDVPMGKTPVVTTWEDLKAGTPVWKVEPEFHRQTGGGTLVWCYLVAHTPAMHAAPHQKDERHLFLRYRLGDQPLFLYNSNSFHWSGFICDSFSGSGAEPNSGMRANGQIFPFHIRPLLTLPEWGDEVQFLLHRARLTDYAVGDDWCAAFESYGELAETALTGLTANDPALQRVRDELARRRFPQAFESVEEGEAWRRLLSIVDEAGRRGEFHFGGYEGAAVRQLAAQITDQSLATRTAAALAHGRNEPGRSVVTSWARKGRATSIWILPRDGKYDPRWALPHVLQQLAVERDATLDAVSPEPDNPIELYVTTALMRQHRVGDGAERQIAGHAYEQALIRHDWQAQPPDPSRFEDSEMLMGATVNHWLMRLAELDTAFGREFRITHPSQFLKLAEEILNHSHPTISFPDSLDFLFHEHRADLPASNEDRKTLAEYFWSRFTKQRLDFGPPGHELAMRWTYLARMAPDSRPEEFAKTLGEHRPKWIVNSTADFLKIMPPDLAVETLVALFGELDRQSQAPNIKPPINGYGEFRRALIPSALAIDDPRMADVILTEMARKDSTYSLAYLASELREGHVALKIVETLARSDRSEIRKTVAETGLFRTSPAERRLVDQLSHDPEESVRAAAQTILNQWAEWKTRPLPSRVLPKEVASE